MFFILISRSNYWFLSINRFWKLNYSGIDPLIYLSDVLY